MTAELERGRWGGAPSELVVSDGEARLEVLLLGPLKVSVRGQPVAVTSGRLRTLLAVLALSPGIATSIERLAATVLDDAAPVDARAAITLYVARLRAALGADAIDTLPAGYALRIAPDNVDAVRFTRLLDAVARTSAVERRSLLNEALALWRGTPFEGLRSAWLHDTESARLLERYLAALEMRIDMDLADGRHAEVVAELTTLTSQFPLRERFWGQLIVALYRSGRQADSLDAYQRLHRLLAEELGIEPGRPIQDLHRQILTADVALDAPAGHVEPGAPVPRQLPAGVADFTGRQETLAQLDMLLPAGKERASAVAISAIVGAAGAGKTALVLHWAHRVADHFPDGQLYIDLRGFDPSGHTMAPQEAVGRFLDALGVPAQQIPTDFDAQTAMYRSVIATRRMLVVLDNAHSADQVRPLLPGAPGCVVVVTSRSRLPSLIGLQAALTVTLDALAPGEARRLFATRLASGRVAAEPHVMDEVVARSDRLPLTLVNLAARAMTHPDRPLIDLVEEPGDTSGFTESTSSEVLSGDLGTPLSWSPRMQLPLDVGDFVGRASATDALIGELTRTGHVPVVIVSGRPGVGKSALAVRVAHRLSAAFPDGQWYVHVAQRDPLDLLAELLHDAGADRGDIPDGVAARSSALRARLAGRRVLLVLDDANGAAQVRPLLPGTVGNAVLITSRSDLSGVTVLDGARNIRLDGLGDADAVALFRRLFGDDRVADEPAATADLARLCGGLPLALRIVAANVRSESDRSIADHAAALETGDRLAGLTAYGDPQVAVRSAFDLSYRALRPDARRMFRLLGLVPGPHFTVDVAAALLGANTAGGADTDTAGALLRELVAANLVERHLPGRYRLHDLLRLYAESRVATDPYRDAAWHRLCRWYLNMTDAANRHGFTSATQRRQPDPVTAPFARPTDAHRWLDEEQSNLVAAGVRALRLGPVELGWKIADALRNSLYSRQQLAEHRTFYEDALRAAEADGSDLAQAAMRHSLGLLDWSIGDLPAAIRHHTAARVLYRRAGDPVGESIGVINTAIAIERHGYSLRSIDLLMSVADAPHAKSIGHWWLTLAVAYTSLGELERAIDHATHGLAVIRRADRLKATVDALGTRAEALRRAGEHTRARIDLVEGLTMCRGNRLHSDEPMLHAGLSQLFTETGDVAQARAHANIALRLTRELTDRWSQTQALQALGTAHRDTDPPLAVDYHERARRLADRKGYRGLVAETTLGLAAAHQQAGDRVQAAANAWRALKLANRLGHRPTEQGALALLMRDHRPESTTPT